MNKNNKELIDVLNVYGLEIIGLEKINKGIINTTYKVSCSGMRGTVLVQKLGSMFTNTVIEDQIKIQEYLKDTNLQISKILAQEDGKKFTVIGDRIWRILEYIPHNKNTPKNEHTVFGAGKILGRFHYLLRDCDYKPKSKIEDFHNTPEIIKKLKNLARATKNKKNGKSENVKKEVDFIVSQVESYYLPKDLSCYNSDIKTETLIHGDPNFHNFLFRDGDVVGFIDLDTIMRSNILIDIGDALRAWCQEGIYFNKTLANMALEGYLSECSTGYILKYSKQATCLITIELAGRFLKDYFEESYFEWDNDRYKSAAEHNLERCREYIKYFKNIIKNF